MVGHILKSRKFDVRVYDIRKVATENIAKKGAKIAESLDQLGRDCDLVVVMVGYDHQVRQVVTDLTEIGKKGAVIVIAATSHPDLIIECGEIAKKRGMSVIDAPVCFGLGGARDGTLASLVGGKADDVEKARPVLECYSRAVHHLGELGAGEIGKTLNNMLHWAPLYRELRSNPARQSLWSRRPKSARDIASVPGHQWYSGSLGRD